MALISWTATTSGSWSDGSNWSNSTGPTRGDDVRILTSNAITVTYAGGSTPLYLNSLGTGGADTLDFTGGTLGVSNGYGFSGALDISAGFLRLVAGASGNGFFNNVAQSGGTITLLGGSEAIGGTFDQTAGLINIANGSFSDQDGGALSGTIAGGGQMIFASLGSTIALGTGFALQTAAAEVQIGAVALNESLAYGGKFTLGQSGVLALNGNTLTLSGVAALDGQVTSGGIIDATATGILNGLILDNGVEVSLTGTYNETGSITVGQSGSGTLLIGAPGGHGGALRLTGNSSIFSSAGGGILTNYGLLAKVGGSSTNGTSYIQTAFTNASSGIVDVAVGTLDFQGPSSGFTSTLAGTITGAGTAAFSAGNYLVGTTSALTLNVARLLLSGSASVTLATASGTNLDYGGNFDMTGGTLVVGSPGQSSTSLTLAGLTAFDGGLVKGTGTVLCAGGAVNLGTGMDLEGNVTFNFQEAVNQTGLINLGLDADAITIAEVAAGDSWFLKGNAGINGFNGQIDNLGTFGKLNGAGDSIVQSGLFNSGTLVVDAGMLTLSGVGSLGGSVTGAAALDISGAYAFAAGLSLTVGEVILDQPNQSGEVQASLDANLSYGGNWAQEGGTLALNGNGMSGNTLTLSGIASLETGAIEGPGELVATGATILGQGLSLVQGAKLQLDGHTEQTGNVVLTGGSSAPTLAIGPAGTYTMDAGVQLGGIGTSVVGTVVVGGTLVANGVGINPTPSTVIAAALVDNGSIVLNYGEMQFLGPVSGHGGITLADGATLDLLASGSVSNGVTFGAGGGILSLGTQDSYLGLITGFATGDMIELQGVPYITTTNSLTISGDTVTINENGGTSVTFTFSSAQSASQLILGEGPHGGAALIHI
jgi:hypothetical protein